MSDGMRSGSAHWNLELAVEVRQCPLRSGARCWEEEEEEEAGAEEEEEERASN